MVSVLTSRSERVSLVNPTSSLQAMCPIVRSVVCLSFPIKQVWSVCFKPKGEFMFSLHGNVNE